MLELWRGGAEVVDGIKRNRTGQGPIHRLISPLFNAVFSRATGVELSNATDFKLLDRRAADGLSLLQERSNFYRGTAQWIGFDRARVEFDVDERLHGASRWRLGTLARLAITGLTSFTAKPLHLVTLSGLAFGLFSLLLGAITLVDWIRGEAVEGFTTVILVLLILGTLILLGMGIIGEYLARIHDEVKARPRYLIAEER
jgi:polyisoprenyl-phosphate glycosyltransferase